MEHPNCSVPGIKDAIRKAGSQSALARLLGRPQPLISKWLKSTRPLRPERCSEIERAVGVSRQTLRPDDWQDIWPELVIQSATHPEAA
ncbi:transcriptional regulator [Paraburkholderia eburnea]|uniref:transcriptional regulator n=1 Tax=Paraburkholderia eburnea TaxID=1189126 RepID=UPI000CDA5E22|nr:YdaS family helix-turn-helix protein [Paraburkholderia eburnea]